MSKKVKWGIIGLGGIANDFARGFKSEKAELVAVGSRTLEKAQNFAEKYQVPKAYGSYGDLYKDEEIDIVYVATPHSFHAENMTNILNAGKHVLCEKAITLNKSELEEVLALAEDKNLIVAEAMTIYHMPIYQKVKERINSGEFGQLKLATASMGISPEVDLDGRYYNTALGGGALLDIGVYTLTFVQYFLDAKPEELNTLAKFHETGVDEMGTVSYSTAEGTLGQATFSITGNLPPQNTVVCEDAYITITGARADKAVITYSDGSTEQIESGHSEHALRNEMENLSEMILTGEDYSHIESTKVVVDLMDRVAREWEMNWIFE